MIYPTPGSELHALLHLTEADAKAKFGDPRNDTHLHPIIDVMLWSNGWLAWEIEGRYICLQWTEQHEAARSVQIGFRRVGESLFSTFTELGAPVPPGDPVLLTIESRGVQLGFFPGPKPATEIGYSLLTSERDREAPWAVVRVAVDTDDGWERAKASAPDSRNGTLFRQAPDIDYENAEGWRHLPPGTIERTRLFDPTYLRSLGS